jgi:hypothetical protein
MFSLQVLFLSLVVGAVVLILGFAVFPDSKHDAVCDQAVRQLLSSHDLAEIARSRALIYYLDCGVRRRIPDNYGK